MTKSECSCGQPKTLNARQCKSCANESRISKLKGVQHSAERRKANSEAKKRLFATTDVRPFALAAHMRGRPHPNKKPVGTERIVKDGRVQVKCDDGKWRYRSRLVWAAAHGEIPAGLLIHHHDENPMNDALENLRMVTRAEHARIHSTPDVARARQALAVQARVMNGSY